MASSPDTSLKGIAEDALRTMDGVSAAVAERVRGRISGRNPDVFAEDADNRMGDPTFDPGRSLGRLSEISELRRQELVVLGNDPVSARLMVADENGAEFVLYVSRVTPETPSGSTARFASYRGPMGRLAALPVGSFAEILTPQGARTFEVIERALVRPKRTPTWDAFDSDVETQALGRVSVPSLQALLNPTEDALPEDILAAMLASEEPREAFSRLRKRPIVDRMGLRDQPILDAAQDAIFRLPLNARVLLTGPPGTGKTTTLIKRLGMKLERGSLTEHEQDLIPEDVPADALPHDKSWIMFTPTELLGLYVREAFSKEGIPAPSSRIQTWEQFSRTLARTTLPILRSVNGTGVFALASANEHLSEDSFRAPESWYEDFETFTLDQLREELAAAARRLTDADDPGASQFARKAISILEGRRGAVESAPPLSARDMDSLLGLGSGLDALAKERRASIDSIVKDTINGHLRRNSAFLDELGAFLTSSQEPPEGDGEEDGDDDEDEDEGAGSAEKPAPSRIHDLVSTFGKALRSWARAHVSGRTVRASSRGGRIAVWLGDAAPSDAALNELGSLLATVRDLRRLARPTRGYLDQLARSYMRFRRIRFGEGRWYTLAASELMRKKALSALEMDIIILLMLRRSRSLQTTLSRRILDEDPRLELLRAVRRVQRNQVIVDEATDFSAVQLACMLELTSPQLRSLFACGDLHQRVTPWGIRNEGQLRWVAPDFDVRPVNVGYRQSTELTRLAEGVAHIMDSDAVPGQPPAHIDSRGVQPALSEGLLGTDLYGWVAARIREIELQLQRLPSVAVFVSGEDSVVLTARQLSNALADYNLRAVDCPDGRVIGVENDVRVFDVRHIKGLEFEAVFFIDVDRLALTEPDLFMKYIYVGTTRAATYLGLTCASILPAELNPLRSQFGTDWAPS